MANQEGFSTNRDLLFGRKKYSSWSIRMRTYLMALGFYIWKLVMTGYIAPTTLPTDSVGKKPSEHNAKDINVILCILSESEFVKVMHCKSTK
jgi:hypothetical protein